jgi:hypothetical protein
VSICIVKEDGSLVWAKVSSPPIDHERPFYLPSPKPRLGGRLFSSACALAGLRWAYRLELRAIFRLCLNTLARDAATKATVEDAAPA